jgi:hypothetical protein
MKARIAFWLAIGVWIAVMPSSIKAQTETPPPAVAKPASLPADVAFGRFIALIRGHLLTGDELIGQRQWDVAARHFSFPREEIYGVIREQLRSYNAPPFDDALRALVRTVKGHSARHYPKARAKVEDALAAADAGLRARQSDWPRFVVTVAVAVLKTAPDEYDDAVAKGRIVHPVGYQTARGFILQADRMFENVAGEFAGSNTVALNDIRAGFLQLKQTFVSVNAPNQAVIDTAAVVEAVSKIELAAGKLTTFPN